MKKSTHWGDCCLLAALVKDFELQELLNMIRYFETQMSKLGVIVSLGKEVNSSVIEKMNPDVVILATGGVSAIPKIPGIDHRKVIDSARLHAQAQDSPEILRSKDPGAVDKNMDAHREKGCHYGWRHTGVSVGSLSR